MTLWLSLGEKQRRVTLPDAVLEQAGISQCSVDGETLDVDARMIGPGVLSLLIGGKQFRCVLDRNVDGDAVVVAGQRTTFSVADPRSLAQQSGAVAGVDGPRSVKASMSGRVIRVLVSTGDEVQEQQGLVVIEAMKMQNELRSPRQGRVSRIAADVGETVAAGDVLIVVE